MASTLIVLLLLFLIIAIKGNDYKIIECVYHQFLRECNLEIFIDPTDVNNFYEPINQKLQYSWTSSYTVMKKYYHQIEAYQMININNNRLNATEYKKVIQLNKELSSFVYFSFFYMNTTNTNIDEPGGFGFAFKFNDYKYSLVHQLKEQNMINHLSYAILPKKTNKGSFFFGGIPAEYIKDVTVNTCKVNLSYDTWGCEMTHICFGNLNSTNSNVNSLPYYSNRHYSYFQVGVRQIKAPGPFIDHLTNTIFFPHLESKKCVYDHQIICAVNVIQQIPLFNFVFEGKFALVFDWNDLFECSRNMCNLLIEKNEEENEWVLGSSFIKKYAFLFDYEDQSISIYTKKDFVSLKENDFPQSSNNNTNKISKQIAWLYCFIIVLLITISGFLAWIKFVLLPK